MEKEIKLIANVRCGKRSNHARRHSPKGCAALHFGRFSFYQKGLPPCRTVLTGSAGNARVLQQIPLRSRGFGSCQDRIPRVSQILPDFCRERTRCGPSFERTYTAKALAENRDFSGEGGINFGKAGIVICFLKLSLSSFQFTGMYLSRYVSTASIHFL